MTVYIICKSEPTEESNFGLSTSDDALYLTCGEHESLLTVNEVAASAGGVMVFWSPFNGFLKLDYDVTANNLGVENYFRVTKAVSSLVCVAMPNQDGTHMAAVVYENVSYSGSYHQSFEHCNTAQAVDLVFPGTSEQRTRLRQAKTDLLTRVAAHDSLSSLEKQVDLLTRLVLDLCQAHGQEQSDAAQALASVLDQADSLAGLTPDQAARKIAGFKNRLRAAQAAYNVAKGV